MTITSQKNKNTEIGSIPEDWEVVLLNDFVIKIGSGITPTGGKTVYKDNGRPFVRSQNIGWGRLLLNDIAFIDDATHQTFPNTEIKLDDVFLNISGASIGRSSFANEKLVGGNVNQHVCIIRTIHQSLNPLFLNLFLLSKKGQKQIDSFQSGGNRQGLNIGQIKTFQILLPPTLTEQTAIANVLRDADVLISSLEKLIAKKRQIKQGTMQGLLKPKEGWVVKKLGEEIDFQGGSQPPLSTFISSAKEGYIRLLQIRDYKTDKYETYIPTKLARKFCKKDDIMIGRYGPPLFQILRGLEGAYNVALIKAIPSNKVYKEFAYHFFKQDSLYSFIEKLSQRTGGQTGIDMEELKGYRFPLPSISEQIQIAQTLSDMDAEIAGLEQKLDKYRKLKAGMMQNLLTGKIRLV